jgi:hypothetical protein
LRFPERLRRYDIIERAAQWSELLERATPSVSASDLYCGDGWSTISKSVTRDGISARLAVVSAGYGLVRLDEQLVPYSVTLARRNPDSILDSGEPVKNLTQWWHQLCHWREVTGRKPASVRQLAATFPSSPLLVALSADYLAATADDILSALEVLRDPELLIIVSVGSKKNGPLSSHFLPCDSRFEHFFGGVRSSLNAKIVHHILSTVPVDKMRTSHLRKLFSALLQQQPPVRTFSRKKMNDEQVIAFINTSLKELPGQSCSTLLRRLRESDCACEQKRFHGLFGRAVG